MAPLLAHLSKEDMLALADYFSRQSPKPTGYKSTPAKAAQGKSTGDAALCTMCHLDHYQGHDDIPRLSGQHYAYLKKQLSDFRAHTRTNDAGNMVA